MAECGERVKPPNTSGGALYIAPGLVVAAVAAGFLPLLLFALAQGGSVMIDAYVWRVVVFTLLQAGLSTLISVVLAVPVARALSFRRFPGRAALMALFAVPQSLPAIVVVLALVELYGQAGWFGGWFSLYGLAGILLAHVFFNLPLAIRFFVENLETVPPESLRLAQQLGFTSGNMWRHVEWPALRPVLPRVAALIFLLCAASFVVVLTLGGPAATTLEVAIYQSLRLDFDVTRAVTLALVQIALCLPLVMVAGRMAAPVVSSVRLREAPLLLGTMGMFGAAAIVLAALLVLPPLLALVVTGVPQISAHSSLFIALGTSVLIATSSACMSIVLAWPLALLQIRRKQWRGSFEAVGMLGIILPPAVLATGWFILMRGTGAGFLSSITLIASLNTLMALPFSVTILTSAMAGIVPEHDRLCSELGISGWGRVWRIDGPALARPLAQAFLMAFVLSFGDLTAVMLLGSQGLVTLPSLIASEMGQYRSATAQGTALVLGALCLVTTWLANRVGQTREART